VDNGKIYLKTPVSYGTESYEAVLIGTQTWLAKNLNYKTSDGASRCYPKSGNTNASDEDNYNCNNHGRLYKWVTAMGLPDDCSGSNCSSQIQSKHRGVCPTGWHIPSDVEWDALMTAVGGSDLAGTKLKAEFSWHSDGNGTDNYGFFAQPGGWGSWDGTFSDVFYRGDWWSATEYYSFAAYIRRMYYDNSYVYRDYQSRSYLLSVRCVKD
jgi:uncharacterized protein (TIGR02145 family)